MDTTFGPLLWLACVTGVLCIELAVLLIELLSSRHGRMVAVTKRRLVGRLLAGGAIMIALLWTAASAWTTAQGTLAILPKVPLWVVNMSCAAAVVGMAGALVLHYRSERNQALELLNGKRRNIQTLENLCIDVTEFFEKPPRPCADGKQAKSCALGLAKCLVVGSEHGLYDHPEFTKEQYAMVGCTDLDTLYRNVGSIMRAKREVKLPLKAVDDDDLFYLSSVHHFQKHLIDDLKTTVRLGRDELGE